MDTAAKQRAEALAVADIKARRQEYLWAAPKWLGVSDAVVKSALEDPRDAPAMWLVVNVICLALPAALWLHAQPAPSHWLGVAYIVLNYALFLQVRERCGQWALRCARARCCIAAARRLAVLVQRTSDTAPLAPSSASC